MSARAVVTPGSGERMPHEWHLVGNIPTCKHCRRAERMLMPRKGDECAARLRAALDDALAAVAARDNECRVIWYAPSAQEDRICRLPQGHAPVEHGCPGRTDDDE